MKKNLNRLMSGSFAAVLALAAIPVSPATVSAEVGVEAIEAESVKPESVETEAVSIEADPFIMVSMGDSYASGEGVEPFFGQDKDLYDRVADERFLAHRSENSWGGQLRVPGITGTMKDYYQENPQAGSGKNVQWYFVAASGAVTADFNGQQKVTYAQSDPWEYTEAAYYVGSYNLPPQLQIFDQIDANSVDYVTVSVGGNDVDFVEVVTACVNSIDWPGGKSKVEKKIDKIWANFSTTRRNILNVYHAIHQKAPNASIIVTGYPQLFNSRYRDNSIFKFIKKDEMDVVNANVTKFNDEIKDMVQSCRNEGIDIHYVDIEEEFNSDFGHGAYSPSGTEWINPIIIGANIHDVDERKATSNYSMHPNLKGTQAYARRVNDKIAEIEAQKNSGKGTLYGKICSAHDRQTPIKDATVWVYSGARPITSTKTTSSGLFSLDLDPGNYEIEISKEGYVDFNAYATVKKNEGFYLESYLLIGGWSNREGEASGIISNALTGGAVGSVKLSFQKGWSTPDGQGGIGIKAETKSNGYYTVKLPVGNYTMTAKKDGFITGKFNIIVVSGDAGKDQNFAISPKDAASTGNYRIVLTWGSSPRDLDSHVVGQYATGGSYHVYYSSKNAYLGGKNICSLDVDDTTSYGPETITMSTATDNTYYYYIHKYSTDGAMSTSGAQIRVYQGANLIKTYNVPTTQTSNRYWNVFAIKNGRIIDRNTVTASPDTSYVTK